MVTKLHYLQENLYYKDYNTIAIKKHARGHF